MKFKRVGLLVVMIGVVFLFSGCQVLIDGYYPPEYGLVEIWNDTQYWMVTVRIDGREEYEVYPKYWCGIRRQRDERRVDLELEKYCYHHLKAWAEDKYLGVVGSCQWDFYLDRDHQEIYLEEEDFVN